MQRIVVERAARWRDCLLLAGVLAASSAVALGMLALRVGYSGRAAYGFLVWNLFLAWLPLLLATAAVSVAPTSSGRRAAALSLGALWLLFFPNAPYLTTDFLHLTPYGVRDGRLPEWVAARCVGRVVPYWFDVLLLVAFAWNGLLLGFTSLAVVQRAVHARWGAARAWAAALTALALAGFGMSIGRFERWNSWDLFAEPQRLLRDVAARVLFPWDHPRTAASSVLFALFLLTAYVTLVVMARAGRDDRMTR